jgi:flagellar biosynthesis GTPase FlhF
MKEEVSAPKTTVTVAPAKKTVSAAPRGVPTINKWTLDSDNAISGIISGSSSFDDGAPVTTSPIVGNAVSGSVVQTKSGSKYFLGDESSGGGFFSLFGGGKDVSSPAPEVKAPPKKDVVAEARKEAESAKEAQRKAQAMKAKVDAEEKKRQIAMEVAAKREADVQARKQADAKAAAAKREAEIQARKQVEEARKQAIEAQKRAAAAQKKSEHDKRQRDAEEKKRIDLEKSERQRKMQQAEQTISKSPRGVTVSLFGFGAPQSDESSTVSKAPTVSLKSATTAPPRGVPVISRWKQERDGSITGVITGSATLNDGDRVTTSPIKGSAIGGTVVTTSSGSRYYLVGSNSATPKAPDEAKAAAAKKVVADKAAKEAAAKSEALARQKEATEKAKREKEAEAQRATLRMKQEREDKAKRATPTLTVAGSNKSPTISLFGLGGNNEAEPASTPTKSQVKSLAPKGVPTITGWKLNRDGSISGRISGSSSFRDGEQVTTSPIAQGRVESGSTVKTGSGSRYFLS